MKLINNNLKNLLETFEHPGHAQRFHELLKKTGKAPKTLSAMLRYSYQQGYLRINKQIHGIKREINLYILTPYGMEIKKHIKHMEENKECQKRTCPR